MTVIVLDQPTTLKLVSMYYKLEEFIADLKQTKDDVTLNVDPDIITEDLEDMISISYEMLNAVSTPLHGAATPGLEWDSEEDEDEEEDYEVEYAEGFLEGQEADIEDGDVEMEGYEQDNPAYEEEDDEDYEEDMGIVGATSEDWDEEDDSWDEEEDDDEDNWVDIDEDEVDVTMNEEGWGKDLDALKQALDVDLFSMTEEFEELLEKAMM